MSNNWPKASSNMGHQGRWAQADPRTLSGSPNHRDTKMVFAPQDLLADPPFTHRDLITCRNLMIYLEPEVTIRVVYLLHSAAPMWKIRRYCRSAHPPHPHRRAQSFRQSDPLQSRRPLWKRAVAHLRNIAWYVSLLLARQMPWFSDERRPPKSAAFSVKRHKSARQSF